MTERMASRLDSHLEAGYRAKRFRKDAVKDGGSTTVQLGGRYRKESEEMQNQVERGLRGSKEVYGEYHFRSDPQ